MSTIQLKAKILIFTSLVLGLVSCASTFKASETLSEETYKNGKSKKGVVLMSINWGRKWSCGNFENAELRNIGFDSLPAKSKNNAEPPSLMINGPSRLLSKPIFINYAFLLGAGEYALSYVKIKAAQSVSNVGYFTGNRSVLMDGGKAKGGSFHVKAGEVVYIGHFWLIAPTGQLSGATT